MAECFLPKDKLPDCWNDEARMNVLFAPLRDKSVNPKDWETKLDFWKNVIYLYCIHNKAYVFTYELLSKTFIRNGRSPACLQLVIDQMYKNGEIKPLHVFQQKPLDSWSGWITNTFVKKPVIWSFTKIKDSIVTPEINISYVHLRAVESEGSKLFENLPTTIKDKVIDLRSLEKLLNYNNTEQLNILLHSLLCKGKVSIKEFQKKENSICLLKFHDVGNSKGITDKDIDIYMLEQSEKTLLEDIEKLEGQVVTLIDDAKQYLSKKQRQSAKTCLRKKKEIEKNIEKRTNTLSNIQILLSRVEDLDSNAQVLDSYQKALTGLRTIFKETGLSEESVSNTMIELEEILEIHDDIGTSLARGNIINDTNVEEELADLLKEETVEQNKKSEANADELEETLKSLNIKLPSPPKSDVNIGMNKISL